jgi:hypothetical protein
LSSDIGVVLKLLDLSTKRFLELYDAVTCVLSLGALRHNWLHGNILASNSTGMPGYHVTIYIDSELLREIEEERGDVPRSRFIVKLIRLGLQAMMEEERGRSAGYRYVRRADRLL